MKFRRYRLALVAVVVVAACALSSSLWPRPEQAAQSSEGVRSEEAYRANNLGVALLEQFKHKEGAEQFRRALTLDPKLALARINLAIALYNVPDLEGAQKEAQTAAVLAPDSAQPAYILGLIARQQSRTDDALAAFRRVLQLDARDVGANVNLGQLYAQQRRYEEAVAAFRVALSEEPYNGTALYNLGTALLRSGQREEGQRLVQQFQLLRQSGAATTIGQNYLEQGRYAEALASTGREPGLVDKRMPDVSFADATAAALPLTKSTPTSVPTPARARSGKTGFGEPNAAGDAPQADMTGGGATLFDFDGDGDLDLFRAPQLLRNDGGRLIDVTSSSGPLASSLGGSAVAGDYNNDGRPDLLVINHTRVSLYRNEDGDRFSLVDAAARIPDYKAVSAALVDADHDGDLDIILAAQMVIRISRGRTGDPPVPPDPSPLLLLRNNGDETFSDVTAAAGLDKSASQAVAVVPTDYDNRRDVDLLVIHRDAPPALWKNLRDGSFRNVAAEVGLDVKGDEFTCAAAGDVNKDGFTDFYFGRAQTAGRFALSDGRGRFRVSDAPAATSATKAAQFLDYDNDGLLDLVAIVTTPAGTNLRVWRNTGDGWMDASERAARGLFVSSASERPPPAFLASGDVDGDGDTDLLISNRRAASAADGMTFARNDGASRNASVRVRLAGKVSNRTGVGVKIEVRAGSLSQKLETYAAAPAPAPSDVVFGLGARGRADAVRVLWPSGVVQAETEFAEGTGSAASSVTLPVTELDRKPSSCPYLYTWNGERFEFVTDFMGGGELGYWAAPGVRAAPDPDEYVRIRGDQLRERDGRYELRVTNELEEALFIDRLQLLAVAHPAEVEVYPNEGLGNPTSARLRLYATRDARPPRAATDGHGHDVLARVARLDRQYPDDFTLLPVRGYAEEHALTIDLGREETGDRGPGGGGRPIVAVKKVSLDSVRSNHATRVIDPRHPAPDPRPHSARRTLLLLTGWTDYAFSSDNVAAAQRGLALRPPALQVRDARGRWRTVVPDIGIPVGRPQTVVVDLTGKFLSASREVRVVTNMRVYWDQVLVDDSGAEGPLRVERLEASAADLRWRGFSAEVTPDGREPFSYDYARVSDLSPWKVFTGRYTRFGDVRELLLKTEDMFVVSRPGDELALSFDAARLAPLPAGWTRTFLLYADGYSKEMDINSASPHEVAPLPFHRMKSYPYAPPASYPTGAAHAAYLERYNTRVVSTPLPQLLTAGK